MHHESTTTVQENPRIKALRDKHSELSEKISYEQRNLSSSDFYINQLKKQKLLIKERLSLMDEDGRRSATR